MNEQTTNTTPTFCTDKALMTTCIQGLQRFAQELEVCQGEEAVEKIAMLRDLAEEITGFWDLDGTATGQ